MKEKNIFKSEEDFIWYKKELDVKQKYEHKHIGKPEKYPALLLESRWEDDPNGPYTYYHSFLYQQKVTCPICKHETFTWP